ncbi:prolactin-releasing peptide receptor-like [Phymastichus coffea]|uniref:prolactin-releasing peptide receptor-like n=1 Tax=Phymastichus coffea TaxID=108790 RepID=UPI00273B0870|nr:prolactin-releasing peptide receptor-like [Phymastichus coffea]XP_058803806.1 prolactin-releasing peptide receptor-like [Phymastichus coffea]
MEAGPAGNGSARAPERDLLGSSPGLQLLIGSLYAGIFLLGLLGNALVCFVVARSRHMQTVTNLFIGNLALSDILMCVLAVPFTPLYTFLGSWVFGDALCHLVPCAQGVSVYLSTLTLTGIALDRFFVILYPLRARMRVRSCLLAILLIWCAALLLTLPYGLYMRPLRGDDGRPFCEEAWPDEPLRRAFSTLTAVLQFGLPFLAIALCYVCVALRLRDRARAKPGSKTGRREEAERERKRRTNRMLVAMVLVFGVSWLPLNLVNVLEDFYPAVSQRSYHKLLFFLAHCLAMSSACYNPFLYAWLNDNFRKEFKQVLPCFGAMSNQRFVDRGEEAGGFNRSERTCCNGAEQTTVQECLLPPQLAANKQYSVCEMISLEPTTNTTKDVN